MQQANNRRSRHLIIGSLIGAASFVAFATAFSLTDDYRTDWSYTPERYGINIGASLALGAVFGLAVALARFANGNTLTEQNELRAPLLDLDEVRIDAVNLLHIVIPPLNINIQPIAVPPLPAMPIYRDFVAAPLADLAIPLNPAAIIPAPAPGHNILNPHLMAFLQPFLRRAQPQPPAPQPRPAAPDAYTPHGPGPAAAA